MHENSNELYGSDSKPNGRSKVQGLSKIWMKDEKGCCRARWQAPTSKQRPAIFGYAKHLQTNEE